MDNIQKACRNCKFCDMPFSGEPFCSCIGLNRFTPDEEKFEIKQEEKMENATSLFGDRRDCERFLYRDLAATQDPCDTCCSSCNFVPSEVTIDIEKETEKMSRSKFEELLKTHNYQSNSNNPLEQYDPKIDPDSITPYRIWCNVHDDECYTTVQWMDGAKTTVSSLAGAGCSKYAGFTAALAKKLYGSTTESIKHMDSAIDKAAEPARRRAEVREFNKNAKKRAHELRMKEREDRIKSRMDQLRIEREAVKRLNAENQLEFIGSLRNHIKKK